jgi:hypothetical protein
MSVCLWVGGEGRLVWAVFSGDERKCEPRSGEQGLSVYKGGLVWGEQVALIARKHLSLEGRWAQFSFCEPKASRAFWVWGTTVRPDAKKRPPQGSPSWSGG